MPRRFLKQKRCSSAQPPSVETNGSVLVIGAGLAGLAAAKRLVESGFENVTVLEARDRIGGRIWTSDQWKDLPPLDMGASWIHGTTGNPIMNLAKTIGERPIFTSYNRSQIYDSLTGLFLSNKQEERMEKLKKDLFRLVRRAQDDDDDSDIRSSAKPLLQRYEETSEDRRFLEFLFQSEFETEYSGSVDELSTYWYDSDKEFSGGDALFEKGYRVITDHLSKGLQIQLGQEVTEIHWQDSATSARVITRQSEFTADHIVVTLPLGVLQQKAVHFYPSLPPQKENAIDKLRMGVLNKCYLRFAEPFWSEKVDWIECVAEAHENVKWAEWVSLLRSLKSPILLGFVAAQSARELELLDDEQIVQSAMNTLRRMFGQNIAEPIDFQITRWANDPYSMGSYSFNSIGSHPGMRKTLAAPVGRVLFFAGEATEKGYFGTTHGAYLSGLRAAEEVVACRT